MPEQLPARRCRHGAFVLEDLPALGRCPECGIGYDLDDPASYILKPPFFHWRAWFPATLTAALCAAATTLICVYVFNSWGAAIWIATPFAIGAFIAAHIGVSRPTRVVALIVLASAAAAGVLFPLISTNLAGVFCLIALVAIMAAPIILGVLVGWLIYEAFKATKSRRLRAARRRGLPLLFFLVPLTWAAIAGPSPFLPAERITTARILSAPVNRAWDSIVFYEEVTHKPPLILRIGLAHPLYTLGRSESVGDVKVCVYNKGRITKQVTEAAPGKLLAFDVIEQHIGYEHDLALTSGSFSFHPVDADHTEAALTTEYKPRLTPRFVWRPFERFAVHTLHNHVLDGMQLLADDQAPREARMQSPEPVTHADHH